jgi:hypothetical protein
MMTIPNAAVNKVLKRLRYPLDVMLTWCTGTLPLLLPDLSNIFASNIFQPTRLTSAMAALFAEEAAQEGITPPASD